jgi:hypothetical protein
MIDKERKSSMFSPEWAKKMADRETEAGVDVMIGTPVNGTDDPTPDLQIVMPSGAMGRWEGDTALDDMLRTIAENSEEDGAWGSKYGADVDNDTFMMHPFCWCESEECPWCCSRAPHPGSVEGYGAPNFWHKASGIKVFWYKYIGRSVEVFGPEPKIQLLSRIKAECLASLNPST